MRGEGERVGGGGKVLQRPQRWGNQRVALHSHCRELAESNSATLAQWGWTPGPRLGLGVRVGLGVGSQLVGLLQFCSVQFSRV